MENGGRDAVSARRVDPESMRKSETGSKLQEPKDARNCITFCSVMMLLVFGSLQWWSSRQRELAANG